MKNVARVSLFVTLFLLAFAGLSFAQDITLAWNPSTDPNVVGYKVYYKADSTVMPFDGAGAVEGHSPITVGDKLTTTLTGLPDGQVYYFAVTAYDSLGQESAYSPIVASQWAPTLQAPADRNTGVSAPVQFSWSTPPAGQQVTYTLYYGTDPSLDPNTATLASAGPGEGNAKPLLAGTFLFGLLGLPGLRKKKLRRVLLVALFGAGLLLGGCGGGSGSVASVGDPSSSLGNGQPVSSQNPATPALFTKKVTGITDSFYLISNLKPGTKYYWKVVVNNGSNLVESPVHSFTTAAN